ncbi:DUF2510 domain-containing protein [Nocardioides flavescens]|uniref:DUF2510 domain-containing protein n=1 Tax=Nocardioides flavescens TaxID=2691959 RepID=A0A6L7ERZ4_9ACTN|nr:DUF2510 domain-containing protein [Nocardioides flavescens]
MTQTPAGWYADPQDATQLRWWDGAAWTEHCSPRPATTTDQLSAAGAQLADGVAKGFTALGKWVNQNTSLGSQTPTFASVAASCGDEPPRHPLSASAELVVAPADLPRIAGVYAATGVAPTPEGTELEGQVVRLVPNPWDPAAPNGVAVLVGPAQVGRLPADLEAAYCPPLAQLTTRRLLATGTARLWARVQVPGGPVTEARVSVRLPEVSAMSDV